MAITYAQIVKSYGSQARAAQACGLHRHTFRGRLAAEAMGRKVAPVPIAPSNYRDPPPDDDNVVEFPQLPEKHRNVKDLIRILAEDSERRQRREEAEKWFPIKIRDNKPIGIMWWGDPHLGTSTHWARLQRDVELCATTKGLYGVNMGDTTNNWVGRLMRLYSEEDISNKSERRLAKWFLTETKIKWLVWLMGNHDEWNHGADILRLMNVGNKVPMLNWAAKFELHFPSGKPVRIHAAHDFPGHSMWNNTHAPARAPRMMGTDADLYVCGHRHDWGTQHYEIADRDQCPMAIRVRGYKRGDSYAKEKGYQESTYGSSILTIIDPTAKASGRILSFVDTDQGARVLAALRGDTEAARKPKAPAKRRRAA